MAENKMVGGKMNGAFDGLAPTDEFDILYL